MIITCGKWERQGNKNGQLLPLSEFKCFYNEYASLNAQGPMKYNTNTYD